MSAWYSAIHPKDKKISFLYLSISGLLSGFCMAFPTAFGTFLEWLCFIPAALVLYSAIENRCSLKSAYWGAFWLIYSQNIVVYHWFISFYPLEFTGMTKLAAAGVVIVAIFGLSFLAAIFGGVCGLLTVLVTRTKLAKRFSVLIPISAAVSYVFGEWIRTKFWFGVPWSRLSLGQLAGKVPYTVLSASVFGSYFVTFLILLVSFLIAQGLFLGKIKLRAITASVLVCSNLIFGIILYNIPESDCNTISVAAIQGNISSRDKWDSEVSSFDAYIDLTEKAASDGADLIVWPETVFFHTSRLQIETLAEICLEYDTNILFGCMDYDNYSPRNILRLIDSSGELSQTVYIKRHLVPFGEYVPMRKFFMTVFPPLAEIGMLSEDLIEGNGSEIFTIEHNGTTINLGGLICFDSIYESLAYDSAGDGADILCVSTNDSWFEDSRAVYMHCEQSRLRAIETGLPVIRAANTGISAIISSKGEVLGSIRPLVEGYLILDISVGGTQQTSYVMNNIILITFAVFVLMFPIYELMNYFYKKTK